jgi:DNA-binding NtrC family response regulator
MVDSSGTLHLGNSPVLAVRDFRLDVVEGPDAGRSFGPLAAVVRVGSAEANEVRLSDAAVSRFHFSIERGPRGLMLSDSGSTNGTFLGTYRVLSAYLDDGAKICVGKTVLSYRVAKEARVLPVSERRSFGQLLGESPAMRSLFSMMERLAKVDAPVLIEGPTGTGKELIARGLHAEGPLKDRPFVVVDCGAATPTLIESELFGHQKGAFTGADQARTGAFELADGGTIFLDEIGELPLPLQPKLLRVLESGVIRPIGSEKERAVRVRVLSATHRNLRHMVNIGTFREDLYFRLAVCPVQVPPLSERPEDLRVLTHHFLGHALRAIGFEGPTPAPSRETLSFLENQTLSGNVRELRNLVERAVILGEPSLVHGGELAPTLREINSTERRLLPERVPLEEAKRRFEREYLVRLVTRHQGDFRAAAEEADIHPKSLQRLVRRHELKDTIAQEMGP